MALHFLVVPFPVDTLGHDHCCLHFAGVEEGWEGRRYWWVPIIKYILTSSLKVYVFLWKYPSSFLYS